MRIEKSTLNKGQRKGGGLVICRPETCDDLWTLYTILAEGDCVSSFTQRKISRETEKGSSSCHKESTYVALDVTKAEFYADEGVLRVSGKISKHNKNIQFLKKLGRFHTISIRIGTSVKIEKMEWDDFSHKKLTNLDALNHGVDFLIVLLNLGICNIFLVSDVIVRQLSCIEQHIPRSTSLHNEHETLKETFFKKILRSLLHYDGLEAVTCVVFAGPDFIKLRHSFLVGGFFELDKCFVSKTVCTNPHLIYSKCREFGRITPSIKCLLSAVLCTVTTPYRHSLEEVICNESMKEKCVQLSVWKHINVLNHFKTVLRQTPMRAIYGPQHVAYAVKKNAVETLVILSTLFRSFDTSVRRRYSALVDQAKSSKAKVFLFSSHQCGAKELEGLGGIIAVLRFGLPELEHLEFKTSDELDEFAT